MATQEQQEVNHIELRRVMEFNNKSKSLGISIPAQWAEQLHLEPKQYVKLELDTDGNGFHVGRIFFQEK